MLRVLLGFFIMGIGTLMVWKTIWFQDWVGQIDWAERKIGPGGTYTYLKLLGVIVIFVGIFVVTNIIGDILTSFAHIFVR